MPRPKNPDCIDWANSQSKKVLIRDLETGYLSAKDAPISPEIAWDYYKYVPEFVEEKVIFKQFKANLKSLRKAFRERTHHIEQQLTALEHDTQFIYKDTHNSKGVKIFRDTVADRLLKDDVKNGLHIELGCEGLYNLRDEYKNERTWDLAFFKRRIRQETLTQKFGHYMEVKRAKKAKKMQPRKSRPPRKQLPTWITAICTTTLMETKTKTKTKMMTMTTSSISMNVVMRRRKKRKAHGCDWWVKWNCLKRQQQ